MVYNVPVMYLGCRHNFLVFLVVLTYILILFDVATIMVVEGNFRGLRSLWYTSSVRI